MSTPDLSTLTTFAQAAERHGLEKDQLMGACNRYIDRAPKCVMTGGGSLRTQYFDAAEMDEFVKWFLSHQEPRSNGRSQRSVPRSDLEIAQAELVRANRAVERDTTRVAKAREALAKAEEALRKSQNKQVEFKNKVAYLRRQSSK